MDAESGTLRPHAEAPAGDLVAGDEEPEHPATRREVDELAEVEPAHAARAGPLGLAQHGARLAQRYDARAVEHGAVPALVEARLPECALAAGSHGMSAVRHRAGVR